MTLFLCGSISAQEEGLRFFPEHASPTLLVPLQFESQTDQILDLSGKWSWSSEGDSGTCWIPGCWKDYDGVVTFNHTFFLPEFGHRFFYRLAFDGVRHACRIRVNGHYLDHHVGATTRFEVNIPERLLHFDGENEIEVEVDNRQSSRLTLPLKRQGLDGENWGGIFRPVSLMAGSRLRIGEFDYHLEKASTGRKYRFEPRESLNLQVHVRNLELVRIDQDSLVAPEEIWLKATLSHDGEVLGESRSEFLLRKLESRLCSLSFTMLELDRWSPAHPVQYDLLLELGAGDQTLHSIHQNLGFRDLRVEEGRLLLNGEPLHLKGVSYATEHPEYGLALPKEQLEADFENLQNLGINLLLHLFGAPDSRLVTLCDRMGILILEELPLSRVPVSILQSPEMTQLVRQRLESYAKRDYHHPSLFALSLGSGFDFSDVELSAWMGEVSGSLDQELKPLLTAGGRFTQLPVGKGVQGLDFLLLEHPFQVDLDEPPVRSQPILMSRIGHPVEPGNSEGYAHPFSLLKQAYHLQQVLLQTHGPSWTARDDFAGTVVHSYADWLGERPLLWLPPSVDPRLRPMGLFSRDRVERPSARETKAIYSETASGTPLTRGEYDPPTPRAYPLFGFALLILLLIGYRQNNVFNHNLRRCFVHSQGFYVDIRDNRVYQFGQSLFLWFLVSGGLALNLSSAFFLLRHSYNFDRLVGLLMPVENVMSVLRVLSWDPIRSLLWLTLVIMGLFLVVAILFRLLGLLFNARFTLGHAMTFLCWSAACLLFMLPLGIVFNGLLLIPALQTPTLLVFALLLFWFLLRLVRTMRIAFKSRFYPAFFLVLSLVAFAVILYAGWLDRSQGLFDYLELYRHMTWGVQ
jgi:hypothetical protein